MDRRCLGRWKIGRLSLYLYNYLKFSTKTNNINVDIDLAWLGITWRKLGA